MRQSPWCIRAAAISRRLLVRLTLLSRRLVEPNFVKADHVREGAVVIDVGINRVEDAATERGYRLVGDVAFDEVSKKARAITPVPGGVGPMTIAMLMSNTVKAARQSL